MKLITVSGINPVLEALKNRPSDVKEILLARKGQAIKQIIAEAKSKEIPIKEVSKDTLHKIVGHKNHQGVIARVTKFVYMELDEFLQEMQNKDAIILLLDSIEDPQNFGSIIRSASFFGVSGIIIPEYRSVSVTDTVSRVSAGGVFDVPIIRVKNLGHAIERLKNSDFLISGLDVKASTSIYNIEPPPKTALVIGNEHRGIKKRIQEQCDILVSIPRFGKMDSLNAAVATAVALSELRHKQTM